MYFYFNGEDMWTLGYYNCIIFKYFTFQFSDLKRYNSFLCSEFANSGLANTR